MKRCFIIRNQPSARDFWLQRMSNTKSRSHSHVQSIQRAVAILRSFNETEPELGVTELSQKLGFHKSTVSRILSTLQNEGLISQNQETNKYRLGVGLVSLAGVALGRLNIRGMSQPHLNSLVEISQETINVVILDGNECVNIERAASPKPIRYVGWIGRRTPLHCTASGKIFLAFMKPQKRDDLLTFPLTKYTDRTIVDPHVLESSLAKICQQGYAIDHEEFEEGFSSIAAPVFDHSERTAGTVSISGPTFRMDSSKIETFIDPLLKTTQTISSELGYKQFLNR